MEPSFLGPPGHRGKPALNGRPSVKQPRGSPRLSCGNILLQRHSISTGPLDSPTAHALRPVGRTTPSPAKSSSCCSPGDFVLRRYFVPGPQTQTHVMAVPLAKNFASIEWQTETLALGRNWADSAKRAHLTACLSAALVHQVPCLYCSLSLAWLSGVECQDVAQHPPNQPSSIIPCWLVGLASDLLPACA